jgi:hypothetical protein
VRPDPLSENASIRFHMISAANQSPLNESIFGKPAASANDKLAGNQLNNFAAFLSARWRQNDWTWVGWTRPPRWGEAAHPGRAHV